MAIPQEILAVERPKSTRVKFCFGRYLVVKRTSKRVDGRVVPVELGTIGEIINGEYVQLREEPKKKKKKEVDIKEYGTYAICDKAAKGLLQDLADVYDISDAKKIYAMAVLRAMDFDIKNRDLKLTYDTSYMSEEYPGIALSENTVSTFLQDTGMAYNRMKKFMTNRVNKFAGSTLVIDGMLKNNNSTTNSFSEYSRKGRIKGSKDLSLIYAYDIENREPVAAKPYVGNMLDQTTLDDFVSEFNVTKGIIIADKGFYPALNKLKMQEKIKKGLHYIVPLKTSSRLIKDNGMYDKILTPLYNNKDKTILYKKTQIADGRFLYSFRNPSMAADQEIGYIARTRKKCNLDETKFEDKQKEFGVIVFESYSDISPMEIYSAYERRWEIELMFNTFKNIIDFDTTNVHSDYSVYATEFINYLSTIITCRIQKIFKTTVLKSTKNGKEKYISDEYSYKQVFRYLSKLKKFKVDNSSKWENSKTLAYIENLTNALGV